MSKEQFPLIKQLGLRIIHSAVPSCAFVYAIELERLLAQAPVVYGTYNEGNMWGREIDELDGVSARLVCIQPIVRDTKESLLLLVRSLEAECEALRSGVGWARVQAQEKDLRACLQSAWEKADVIAKEREKALVLTCIECGAQVCNDKAMDALLKANAEIEALKAAHQAEIEELKRTEKVYHMNREWIETAKAEIAHWREQALKLKAALEAARGQWIHSVNAEQCLQALSEFAKFEKERA